MSELLSRERHEPKGRYGKPPGERSMEELLEWGVVNIDKPSGPTSHQVVAWIKQMLGIKRAGHGGTLDPNVTGVLPTALGRATKAIGVLLTGNKEYVGVIMLHRDVPKKRFKEVFDEFKGEIFQIPPVRSAVKRALRTRHVYESEVIEMKGRKVLFRVSCEAGTYIRSFAHDIGEALGVGAHLAQLRRTRTASFTEGSLVTLHNLKDAFHYWKDKGDEEEMRSVVQPFERLFDHMPRVVVKDAAASAVGHGAPLAAIGISKASPGIMGGEKVVVLSLMGEGVAVGRAVLGTEDMLRTKKGIAVEIERVLKNDSFPKLWKTKAKGKEREVEGR